MAGGRKSQRKGRGAELELRNILKAAGWDVAVLGIYEPHDLLWAVAGRDRFCEAKRRKNGMEWAYKALLKEGNHAVFFRADNQPWLVIQTLSEYIFANGPRWPGDAQESEPGGDREGEAVVAEIPVEADR